MNTNTTVDAPQNTIVKIIANDKGNPTGKFADAEIHFIDGVFAGLRLIGFAIWERRAGAGRNVTFPARQYSVNGERRSFALLRPAADHRPGGRPRPGPLRLREVRTGGVTDLSRRGARGRSGGSPQSADAEASRAPWAPDSFGSLGGARVHG